jgi:transcriptional regulator with XRE-family HTH domain
MAHSNKIHEGRNVKRFREMLGIKQDTLAFELGDDWTQKKISLLEQKETIEPDILSLVSGVLKIPVEAFQNFDEEQAVNIISNTINNHDQSAVIQYNPVFNPIEKWLEALEEIKRLNAEVIKEKESKIKLLEEIIRSKV